MNLTAVTLAALLVCRAPLEAAQDPVFERVEISVTAIAGRSVFLDKGREAGVRRGDTVYLFPLGSPAIEGTVRTVSSSSSRATFTGIATLGVGDRGAVPVPAARPAPVGPEPGGEAPVSEPAPGGAPRTPRRRPRRSGRATSPPPERG